MNALKCIAATGAALALAVGGLMVVAAPAASVEYCSLSASDYWLFVLEGGVSATRRWAE